MLSGVLLVSLTVLFGGEILEIVTRPFFVWRYHLIDQNLAIKAHRLRVIYFYGERAGSGGWAEATMGLRYDPSAFGYDSFRRSFSEGKLLPPNRPLERIDGYDLQSVYGDIRDNVRYEGLLDEIALFLLDVIENPGDPHDARYAVEDLINLYHHGFSDDYDEIMFNHPDEYVRKLMYRKMVSRKFIPHTVFELFRIDWQILAKERTLANVLVTGEKNESRLAGDMLPGDYLLRDEKYSRLYYLHIPAAFGNSSVPLIVALHGSFCGDSAMRQFRGFLENLKRDSYMILAPEVDYCYGVGVSNG